jgi:hypothetical protein
MYQAEYEARQKAIEEYKQRIAAERAAREAKFQKFLASP